MKIILDNGKEVSLSNLSFTDWRRFMSEYMQTNPNAGKAWDVMAVVRGPDSPSETPDMSSSAHSAAYKGRRARKFNTVEVLREEMFFGTVGGCARHHKDSKVVVPPNSRHDHFDRHVVRAATILGLDVEYKDDAPSSKV